MNTWEFLRELNETCCFASREKKGRATNSELKRWCERSSVVINGQKMKWNEEIEFPIFNMVLFPKRNRVTLF